MILPRVFYDESTLLVVASLNLTEMPLVSGDYLGLNVETPIQAK